MKKIKDLESEYFRTFVEWQKRLSNLPKTYFPSSEHSKLFSQQHICVANFVRELRSKPRILLTLIEKNKLSVSSSIRSLPQMLSQTFFCPPLRQESSPDTLIFINKNIDLEIGLSSDRQNMLRTDTLPKKIIKEYLNQHEFTAHLLKIFKDALQEIAKI